MDKTIPAAAAILLDFIGETETGEAGRAGYDVIYAHQQGRLPKPITSMTIAELQGHQASGWPAKSTASGRYQFMRATLAELRKELALRDSQIFDPDLQDRLGYHLLIRRGYRDFVGGRMSRTEFGARLAMEWASFPVLADRKGSNRQVARGQSYYAGDGLNKALVHPSAVEAVLDRVLAAAAAPSPAPVQPPAAPPDVEPIDNPPPAPTGLLAFLARIFSGLFRA
ncbi:hypothetical protein [Methylobrevis pamukkalensis]|uniref:Uncharacterized protein n=1 Tax=Methylobrevis pamukkalensis TaxID=1439726 RepID=A0A1E3H0S5_9HYPH|nr:hypothetical protein [Methylobrevis pamukkalensis]ODN69892.1 hypothetical protein A6302_02774 [Methylobrevis pamukkalensis]